MIGSCKTNFEKSELIPHTRISSQSQIENIYEVGEKIGQGSFGKVFSVTEKSTGIKWAMKCIHKIEKSLAIKLLEREVAILKRVQHENIIQLKEVFETHDKVFLIMEYCGGGELAAELLKVKKFSEVETKKIMSSLASAIAYLHKSDIVHRDLKLSNILLSDNPIDDKDHLFIKVTDFGLSVIKGGVGHENMLNSFCGTLIYMAPEVVENKTYSQQCDVWAMGVIAYQLLCGSPPFISDDEDSLMAQIRQGEFDFFSPDWDDISSEAKNCIQNMLHLDTGYRLTAAEVLQHSWFTGVKKDSKLNINVLEMMSSWKDDLIKDHLKEDLQNEAQNGDSENEDAQDDETENVSVEDKRKKSLVNSKSVKTKKEVSPTPTKTQASIMSASGSSRSTPDRSFLSKSLVSRPNKMGQFDKSTSSKQNPEKNNSMITQSRPQAKTRKS